MAKPQPKLPTETDRQFFRRNFPVVALLTIFGSVNLFLALFFSISTAIDPSGLLVYSSLGVVAAQISLLGLLLALFPTSLLFRILTIGTALVVVGLSILLGEAIFDSWNFHEISGFDMLPVFLLGFSVPFFLARYLFRWKLEIVWIETPDHSHLSVAGLMIGTAVAALTLTLLRLGEDRLILLKLVAGAGCMGASFAIFVPFTYLIMTSVRKWVWLVVFAMVPLMVGIAIVEAFGFYLSIPYWVGVGIAMSISFWVFWFGIGLIALQRCGGRLTTPTIELGLGIVPK